MLLKLMIIYLATSAVWDIAVCVVTGYRLEDEGTKRSSSPSRLKNCCLLQPIKTSSWAQVALSPGG